MGEGGAKVILAAYEDAMKHKNPIVGIWHSGGARLREGVKSLHAFGLVFNAITQASGKIPQFSLVLGPAAGGGAYGPALTDVIVLAPEGRIALRDLVEEELLLAVPLVPRHENEADCGRTASTEADVTQTPFAGLGELLKRGRS